MHRAPCPVSLPDVVRCGTRPQVVEPQVMHFLASSSLPHSRSYSRTGIPRVSMSANFGNSLGNPAMPTFSPVYSENLAGHIGPASLPWTPCDIPSDTRFLTAWQHTTASIRPELSFRADFPLWEPSPKFWQSHRLDFCSHGGFTTMSRTILRFTTSLNSLWCRTRPSIWATLRASSSSRPLWTLENKPRRTNFVQLRPSD